MRRWLYVVKQWILLHQMPQEEFQGNDRSRSVQLLRVQQKQTRVDNLHSTDICTEPYAYHHRPIHLQIARPDCCPDDGSYRSADGCPDNGPDGCPDNGPNEQTHPNSERSDDTAYSAFCGTHGCIESCLCRAAYRAFCTSHGCGRGPGSCGPDCCNSHGTINRYGCAHGRSFCTTHGCGPGPGSRGTNCCASHGAAIFSPYGCAHGRSFCTTHGCGPGPGSRGTDGCTRPSHGIAKHPRLCPPCCRPRDQPSRAAGAPSLFAACPRVGAVCARPARRGSGAAGDVNGRRLQCRWILFYLVALLLAHRAALPRPHDWQTNGTAHETADEPYRSAHQTTDKSNRAANAATHKAAHEATDKAAHRSALAAAVRTALAAAVCAAHESHGPAHQTTDLPHWTTDAATVRAPHQATHKAAHAPAHEAAHKPSHQAALSTALSTAHGPTDEATDKSHWTTDIATVLPHRPAHTQPY